MRTLALVGAALSISSAAFAQSPGSPDQTKGPVAPTPQSAQTQPTQIQPTGQIAQQIRKNLEQAGFKEIKLMSSSFLVRAQDKDGNPVMMVINPDSVTAFTEIGQSNSATTGQGSTPPSANTAPKNSNVH